MRIILEGNFPTESQWFSLLQIYTGLYSKDETSSSFLVHSGNSGVS